MRGCSIVNNPFINRQDACSTREVAALSIILLSTGKMPVPQEMNFIVEQASCLLSENGAISSFCESWRRNASRRADCLCERSRTRKGDRSWFLNSYCSAYRAYSTKDRKLNNLQF